MKWRFQCIACGLIFEECLRIEDVYHNWKMNITHYNKQVKVLVYGAPFK